MTAEPNHWRQPRPQGAARGSVAYELRTLSLAILFSTLTNHEQLHSDQRLNASLYQLLRERLDLMPGRAPASAPFSEGR